MSKSGDDKVIGAVFKVIAGVVVVGGFALWLFVKFLGDIFDAIF